MERGSYRQFPSSNILEGKTLVKLAGKTIKLGSIIPIDKLENLIKIFKFKGC